MNSIGVASLFLPVVIDIARRTKQPPSKLLIPLAFAALLGGLTTLIGTPPNILISNALKEADLRPFSMFDYTPIGISLLLAGTAFMALIGRKLLPNRDPAREFSTAHAKDFKSLYELNESMVILHLPEGSILNGKTLAESRLGSVLGLNVVAVIRDGHSHLSPQPSFTFQTSDRLMVEGSLEQLTELHSKNHLVLDNERFSIERLVSEDVELIEAHLSSRSSLIGQTIQQIGFRENFGVIVLAILREGVPFRTNLETIPLLFDDRLLIQGRRKQLE